MIAHVTLHVSNYQKSKEFYTKALAPLGYYVKYDLVENEATGFMSGEGNTDFWIDGDGAKQLTHIAFTASSEDMVQNFYRVALEAGGKDNGSPGYRSKYGAGYYAAFVLDPDGHNIEAMFWNPDKK